MQLFSADAMIFLKKFKKKFAPKVAHNWFRLAGF